jgi:peptidoglycan/LPS O-acetylase OafA/YrhL
MARTRFDEQRSSVHRPTSAPTTKRSVGLDALKGVAILMVIVQHTVPGHDVRGIWGAYWIHQAVPIFLIIFGFNGARVFRRSGARRLRDLYTRAYLTSRVRRLIVPALTVYLAIGLVASGQGRLHIGGLVLFGAAPLAGGAPGDYFVGLAVWLAFLLPLAWAWYVRAPRTALAGLVVISIVFELLARPVLLGFSKGGYFDGMSPLRAAAAVAAGIWLAEVGGPAAAIKHRAALAVLGLLSGLYLVAYQIDVLSGNEPGFGIFYPNFTVDTGVWAVGWSLLLTVVLLLALDGADARLGRRNPGRLALSGLAELGKASYHVFLLQAAILGLWLDRRFAAVIVQVALALAVGWLYWATTSGPTWARRARKVTAASR